MDILWTIHQACHTESPYGKQEKKMKRAQGIGGPRWTHKEEQDFQKNFLNVSAQGVCFVAVKWVSLL